MDSSEKRTTVATFVLLALGIGFTCSIMFAPGVLGFTETTSVSDDGLTIDVTYTDRDLDPSYDETSATILYLADGASTVQGSGASVYNDVITITDEGTYVVSGSLSDGQIVIYAGESDKVQLVLDGVTISCSDNPAIYVAQADKVFITLAEGSVNTLEDGSEYISTIDAKEAKATIYSRSDLTLNGQGTLIVTGNYLHAIASQGDLVITGGTYVLTAVGDGLHGKESVKIYDGTITITAGDEGIQSDQTDDEEKGFVSIDGGSITITSTGDGIEAVTVLRVAGGEIDITTGEGSGTVISGNSGFTGSVPDMTTMPVSSDINMTSDLNMTRPSFDGNMTANMGGGQGFAPDSGTTTTTDDGVSAKGLKANELVLISGGTITLDCEDDGIHSNGDITISGGTFSIASGDDGMHADDDLVIDAGSITVTQSYEGLEGSNITINGGQIDITSTDDGMNAGGGADSSGFMMMGGGGFDTDTFTSTVTGSSDLPTLTINGGVISVFSTSGDGVDSNGDITINGGTLFVEANNNGNSAIDAGTESGGTCVVNGGTVLAVGSLSMAEGFASSSGQPSLMYNFDTSAASGTTISLTDASGNVLLTYTPSISFNSVIISMPDMAIGSTYTLAIGSIVESITLNETAGSYGTTSYGMMGGGGFSRW
ncbi:carbohydrate-binding domain-containing protein [uncultured Methanocorpusculum sp.]|nr:carbohydrate-binding domain-containing protein [uncultured Methanocorpusculum sp.]